MTGQEGRLDPESDPEAQRQARAQHLAEDQCSVELEADPETAETEAEASGVDSLEPEALWAEIVRLREREEELSESLLRLRADFDNYRRRNRRELQEGITRANEELIGQLLPVLDNLDRALAVQGDARDNSIRDGLELVYRQFLDILAKEGLEPIKAVGEVFDPNIHNAVMVEHVDDPEMDNRIIQELQKGYSFRERVLRAAVVKVAKASD